MERRDLQRQLEIVTYTTEKSLETEPESSVGVGQHCPKKVRRGDRESAGDLMEHNKEPLEWRSEEGSLSALEGTSRRAAGKRLGSAAQAAGRSGTLRIPFIFAKKGRNSSGDTSGYSWLRSSSSVMPGCP